MLHFLSRIQKNIYLSVSLSYRVDRQNYRLCQIMTLISLPYWCVLLYFVSYVLSRGTSYFFQQRVALCGGGKGTGGNFPAKCWMFGIWSVREGEKVKEPTRRQTRSPKNKSWAILCCWSRAKCCLLHDITAASHRAISSPGVVFAKPGALPLSKQNVCTIIAHYVPAARTPPCL